MLSTSSRELSDSSRLRSLGNSLIVLISSGTIGTLGISGALSDCLSVNPDVAGTAGTAGTFGTLGIVGTLIDCLFAGLDVDGTAGTAGTFGTLGIVGTLIDCLFTGLDVDGTAGTFGTAGTLGIAGTFIDCRPDSSGMATVVMAKSGKMVIVE